MTANFQFMENILYNINAADRKIRLLCNIEVSKFLFGVYSLADDVIYVFFEDKFLCPPAFLR